MLVQNGDVIQLTVDGQLQGQDVLNVFHFLLGVNVGGAVNISDVIPLWFIDFDTSILTLLVTDLEITSIRGINLSNPDAIYEESVQATGDVVGESLPVHDTISVKLIRTTGVTRNGRKSYSGVNEGATSNGDLLYSPAQLQAIEEFHYLDKVYPIPDEPTFEVTFQPVIVGRTQDVNGVYQLDLSKLNAIRGAEVNGRIRTQNTRKF